MVGNARVALIYLAVILSFAAFGEGFVYRGYIHNRMAEWDEVRDEKRDQVPLSAGCASR